jgi:energy-coupling factor transporter ATP-binding protein EcfA2
MLKALRVENYRCFAKAALEDCGRLVVLIGENDSGKSSLLDAIELGLGLRRPSPGDMRRYPPEDPRQNAPLVVELEIELPQQGAIPARYTRDGKRASLLIRRTIGKDLSSKVEVHGMLFDDPVFQAFGKASAGEQKAALSRCGVDPGANADVRGKQFAKLVEEQVLTSTPGWFEVPYAEVQTVTPSVSKVAASDYDDPMHEIQTIVSDAVRKRLADLQVATPEVFATAQASAQQGVDAALAEMRPHLQAVFQRLQDVTAWCTVDFQRPQVRAGLQLDLGDGPKPLAEMGQGTRRRAWMALQHGQWQNAPEKASIRLYDEPDANLHYEAQRSLYKAIKSISGGANASQLFVCTHAVTLIDSVAPRDIRVIRSDRPDGHAVESLVGRGVDPSALDAIAEVGGHLGLGNLVLLYERAFLLVEGETESGAFPALYRTLHGVSPEEHGIRVVNLDTCGAWRSVVKVLLKARANITVMMLDNDCTRPGSSAKLTKSSLGDLGVDSGHVFLVGTKEFEDAFANDTWLRVLATFPRMDGATWEARHVQALRESEKFSDAMVHLIRTAAVPGTRSNATKPELGRCLAQKCLREEMPSVIIAVVDKLRQLACC